VIAKPTVSDLGVDPAAQVWHRSGHGDGAIEVAFVRVGGARSAASADTPASANTLAPGSADTPATAPALASPDAQEWVLMRVAGDPEQRVLVFDRHEWECFLDGARNGEFDDAAAGP
jgi:hypothetical protein